jgi:hypothetical protein
MENVGPFWTSKHQDLSNCILRAQFGSNIFTTYNFVPNIWNFKNSNSQSGKPLGSVGIISSFESHDTFPTHIHSYALILMGSLHVFTFWWLLLMLSCFFFLKTINFDFTQASNNRPNSWKNILMSWYLPWFSYYLK